MAAQHSTHSDFTSRYKFNSLSRTCFGRKELDQETGWYYYGARYYDPAVSQWLSIDPLTEKYPGISPYNYTADNPVMLVDPDGRDPWPPLRIMKVRRNRASNLGPGMLRNGGSRFHAGHDLYAPAGTEVMSVKRGVVIMVGVSNSYGNYITIKHEIPVEHTYKAEDGSEYHWTTSKTTYSFYAHLQSTSVNEGDEVSIGQTIGTVGTSGNSSAGKDGLDVHLHFEYGEELRGNGRKMLKKSALLNPNEAYDNLRIESLDPDANQTNTGVMITEQGSNKQIIKMEVAKPNKKTKTTFYFNQ